MLNRGVSLLGHILLDIYSLSFVRFILLISFVVIYYRYFYIHHDLNAIRFFTLVFLFVGSIVLLVFSPSLLSIIFGWDGLGVSSFLLVIYYNNVSSLRSGMLTIYTNRLGDIFFMFSFFFMFSCGWFILDVFFLYFWGVFSFFIILAGITKRAQIPFSSWLPAAISAPTPVSSLVHSSTLVTAGVYLFIRFFYILRNVILGVFFCVVSLITFFSAGIMACVEIDLKKLVAISTLRQLGVLMFSFSQGFVFLTFFHIISHALFKSLLFLTCGLMILTSFSLQDMRFIGNKFIFRKSVFLMLVLSVIRLRGFPFLRGFFSKDLIIDYMFFWGGSFFICLLFCFSCVVSVLYGLKLVYAALLFYQKSFSSVFAFFKVIMLLRLGFLFVWSVCFGKIFFLILFDGEVFMFISWQKFVGFLLVILVVFIYFINVRTIFRLNLLAFFFEIFFLNWFFGGFLTSKLKSSSVVLVGEGFWLELLGAKGVFEYFFTKVFFYLVYKINYFFVVFIFFIFGFVFLTILLPFSL